MENIDSALLQDIKFHAGCPCPIEAVQIVYDDSKKEADSLGKPLEFCIAERVKALYASALGAHRSSASKAQFDFEDYCKRQLAPKDNLFGKIFKKRDKVAAAQAELAEYEAAIASAKEGLRAGQAKVVELQNHIASAESDLEANSDEAVEAAVFEACKVWHLRGKTNHYDSVVSSAVSRVADQEAVNRVLDRRLVWLREALVSAQSQVESFKKQLKDLE